MVFLFDAAWINNSTFAQKQKEEEKEEEEEQLTNTMGVKLLHIIYGRKFLLAN